MFTDDVYEGTKNKIDKNLKIISKLTRMSKENEKDPKYWFEAWGLLRETATLVEELEQEYYRLNGKENLN